MAPVVAFDDADTVSEADAISELTGSTPEGEEETSVDETDESEDEGPQIEVADEGEDSEDDESPEDEPSKETKQELSEVKAFIDKTYAGDEQAFLKGMRESWTANSRMQAKIDRLEELLEEVVENKSAPSPPAALQQLESIIATAESEIRADDAAQTSLVREINKADREIAKLEGKLEQAQLNGDEAVTREYRAEFREAKSEKKELERQWKTQDRELRSKLTNHQSLRNQLAEAAAKAQEDAVVNKQRARQDRDRIAQTNEIFETAIDNAAKEYGYTEKTRNHLHKVVIAEFRAMAKANPTGNALDLSKFVKEQAKDYNEAQAENGKKVFTKKSQEKIAASRKVFPGSKAPVAQLKSTVKSPKQSTAQYWRDRARKMLGE